MGPACAASTHAVTVVGGALTRAGAQSLVLAGLFAWMEGLLFLGALPPRRPTPGKLCAALCAGGSVACGRSYVHGTAL